MVHGAYIVIRYHVPYSLDGCSLLTAKAGVVK